MHLLCFKRLCTGAAATGINFAMSLPRSGGSSCSSRPLRSFAGYPHGFGDVHTKARISLPSPKSTKFMVTTCSTMAGVRAGLAALELRAPFDEAIELVGHLFEHGDENDVLFARVLKLLQPITI